MKKISADNIRRLPNGSIDLAFYIQQCHEQRRRAAQQRCSQFIGRFKAMVGQFSDVVPKSIGTFHPSHGQVRLVPAIFKIGSKLGLQ